ncbi:MAG: glycosyltransferase family 9 protein [Vicinamibacteria bacterium]
MSFGPSRDLAARRLRYGGPRIYDRRERWLLAGFDVALRVATPLVGLAPSSSVRLDAGSARRILAVRLDRLGDLLMTLPALAELRRLAPDAEIELAVGSWNEEIARGLPFVDRLRIVDAPWSAWGKRVRWRDAERALRDGGTPDLAIEFQGDVRAIMLMARTGATLRAGYGDTGGGYLLTHVGLWDEARSWYRQNVELLGVLFPGKPLSETIEPYNFLLPEDRRLGQEVMDGLGLKRRPFIGIHPSAGRAIKQWQVDRYAALADRLAEATSGTVILTGSASDRELVEKVAARTESGPLTLIGGVGLRGFAALLERLDLFVSGDTGPMHLADAVACPGVAIFGPSDPRRYRPESDDMRTVVRNPLYCSPCNMIRRPPRECAILEAPECVSTVTVDQVFEAALHRLASARDRSFS